MEPKYIYVHSFTKYDWNSTTHQARHYPYTYFSNSNPLGFFLTKEDKKQLLEIKNKNSNNKLQDNTSIHVTKFSTLPKYKLDNYIEENKLKINRCRFNKNPDSLVVNFDNIQKEFFKYGNTYYAIPGDIFCKYTDLSIIKKDYPELYLATSGNLENYTYLHPVSYNLDHLKSVNFDFYRDILKCEKVEGYNITKGWGSKLGYENIDMLFNILSDEHNIICDSSINKEINTGTVIDLDLFKTLLDMASSTDSSNLSLVREFIANSEIETSKPYILFLLWWNEPLRKIDNNANYKFCLDQLKEFKNHYSSSRLEYFMAHVIKRLPEHKQAFFDCLTIHLNHISKQDLIKQLVVS